MDLAGRWSVRLDGSESTSIQLPGTTDLAGLGPVRVRLRGAEVDGLARTFGERAAGELTALINHVGELEVAVVNGNAGARLGVSVGDPIDVIVESI